MFIIPAVLTLSRIALIPFVFYYLFVVPHLSVGVTLYTIGLLTDTCDGMAARYFGVVSEWGSFWDPLADKLFLWSFFAGAAYAGIVGWWLVAVFVIRDVFVTFMRMYAQRLGRTFVTSQFAKYKTLIQCILGYVVLACQASFVSSELVIAVAVVTIGFSYLSAAHYVLYFPPKEG